MEIILIIAAIAAIVAGIYESIQLLEWYQKRKKMQKRKKTIPVNEQTANNLKDQIKIINFTHPLTDKIIQQIENTLLKKTVDVIEIKTHLDEEETFDKQIDKLVDRVGFSSEEWQTNAIIIHVPGFAQAAATLVADVHGRMGHFPSVLRLKAIEDTAPRQFELAEIINLQDTRDAARENR